MRSFIVTGCLQVFRGRVQPESYIIGRSMSQEDRLNLDGVVAVEVKGEAV